MRAQYKGINVKDLVKYPHGQHREGGVDNVEECDEVLIIYGLQKKPHTDRVIIITVTLYSMLLS